MRTKPKRILICATQVPFTRGGAELLVDGLRDALREQGHTVDVVSLPFAWQPHELIGQSALAWRLLDLTSVNAVPVDQVICTKFPSYAVRHPRKVVWLVHQHRQAYDWYGTPFSDFANTPEDRANRDLLMRMDRTMLGEAQGLYTISRNVSARLKRFNGLDSQPLYPPSRYTGQLHAGAYGDYILSDARLDAAKRLDLLLHALAKMETPFRCLFTSTGPERAKLEQLAQDLGLGHRVTFLGYVPDQQLINLYAEARAVYYAPFDEDYGFTTVQALAASRPVVTTTDAGGVLEFIDDGHNGFVVAPDPAAIAARLDMLANDPALAERLGANGPQRVADITWDRVIHSLVI
jgi:glycosyltransferase involved in cell wall biosynthesis